MENPIPEEENIINDVRNLFRLEKLKEQTIDTTIKDIWNLFRLEKENKTIKDIIFRDIRNLFENEAKENYYQWVTVSNFWSNYYIEYKSNRDRIKTVEEY